jgi:hypothetical protein
MRRVQSFLPFNDALFSAGIAQLLPLVNAKNCAIHPRRTGALPRSRETAGLGLLPARRSPEVDAAVSRVAVDFAQLVR